MVLIMKVLMMKTAVIANPLPLHVTGSILLIIKCSGC